MIVSIAVFSAEGGESRKNVAAKNCTSYIDSPI